MRYRTKEELIAGVQELQEIDDQVYAVLERYFNKYDLSPNITDVMDQLDMHSEMEVFQSWCETDDFCREECEQKLELLIVEYACRNNGDFPTIADILKHYERSALYPVIEERAVSYICSSYELTNQIPPRVRLGESHKESLRRAISSMKSGYRLKAV